MIYVATYICFSFLCLLSSLKHFLSWLKYFVTRRPDPYYMVLCLENLKVGREDLMTIFPTSYIGIPKHRGLFDQDFYRPKCNGQVSRECIHSYIQVLFDVLTHTNEHNLCCEPILPHETNFQISGITVTFERINYYQSHPNIRYSEHIINRI